MLAFSVINFGLVESAGESNTSTSLIYFGSFGVSDTTGDFAGLLDMTPVYLPERYELAFLSASS